MSFSDLILRGQQKSGNRQSEVLNVLQKRNCNGKIWNKKAELRFKADENRFCLFILSSHQSLNFTFNFFLINFIFCFSCDKSILFCKDSVFDNNSVVWSTHRFRTWNKCKFFLFFPIRNHQDVNKLRILRLMTFSQSSQWAPAIRPKTSNFFSFYLELDVYTNKFKNLIWTSKLKFSFRGLFLIQTMKTDSITEVYCLFYSYFKVVNII